MITIRRNIDIAPHTTFGIHAKAAAFVDYETAAELAMLLHDESLPRPLKHIGAGSNLLFTADFAGTLLHCRNRTMEVISTPDPDRINLRVAAGAVMDDVCHFCAMQLLWGPENLSGIPGEAGAAPVQNVGAYGVEAADIIESVEAIDAVTGAELIFYTEDMDFGYRHSMFKRPENQGRYVVTAVTFSLSRSAGPRLDYAHLRKEIAAPHDRNITPMMVREAVIRVRDGKLPAPQKVGSAGSFFKNPIVTPECYRRICELADGSEAPCYIVSPQEYKVPAAWLIDRCGWKGRSHGGASVWQSQPLVIVNADGTATGADVVDLEQAIVQSVQERFGVTLTPEVEHIGA